MGLLTDGGGWGGGQKGPPLPKICYTFPTMMKLGTLIPYLEKIENIYKSRDTPFYWKSANFAMSRNTDIDCILIHYFDTLFLILLTFFEF